MVKLNKIYTRTGDSGQTSLVGGKRVFKYDLRIEAVGSIDETNSSIGISSIYSSKQSLALLQVIQNDLFDLGADVSTPMQPNDKALRIIKKQVSNIETKIDEINSKLKDLDSFVLPGGSKSAANLHLSRTICRRAERHLAALAEVEQVNPIATSYINRLSDLLFVLARFENNQGQNDILWKPAANQV